MLPGFGELMRSTSLRYVPTAILSRQTAGIRGAALIVNLPGKPKAIRECLEAAGEARRCSFLEWTLDLEEHLSLRGELDQSAFPFCSPLTKMSRRGVLLLTKMGETVLQETQETPKFYPILNEEIRSKIPACFASRSIR